MSFWLRLLWTGGLACVCGPLLVRVTRSVRVLFVMWLISATLSGMGCDESGGGAGVDATHTSPSPLTLLSNPHVDLGHRECTPGEPIVVEWLLECAAEQLSDLAATSSCGCTDSILSATRLRSGDKVTLTATLQFSREGRQYASIRVHDGRTVLAETSVSAQVVFQDSLAVVGCRLIDAGPDTIVSLIYKGRSPPARIEVVLAGSSSYVSAPDLKWEPMSDASESGRGLWMSDIVVPLSGAADYGVRLLIRCGTSSIAAYPRTLASPFAL